MNAIDHDHPDIAKEEDATSDLVSTSAALLFGQDVVQQIIGLLEGTTVYTYKSAALAPLTINVPNSLSKKLKFSKQKDATPPTGSLQLTGILTDTEVPSAKALSPDPEWGKAIDCAGKQPSVFFSNALFGIFSADIAEAQQTLLAGDVTDPGDQKYTAPGKRFYFLQKFLPFLREQLAQPLVIDTLSGAAGLATDITNLLLSEILQVGTPAQPAMTALEHIKDQPATTPGGWTGYLIPPANAAYIFVINSDAQPADLLIGGQQFSVSHEDDPANDCSGNPKRWSTDAINLKAGNLYPLTVKDRTIDKLQWKTAISPLTPILNSALLPDYSTKGTSDAFTKLYKAALIVNGFNLSADEAGYLQSHQADFDGFDFNAVSLQSWKRLQAYTDLRNNLPRTDLRLIDLFQWAGHPDDPTKLSEKIAGATTWKQNDIDKLIAPAHFDLDQPKAFVNEVDLVKLRQATSVANKIAVDIDRLFDWAKPGSKFWPSHQIAEDIRKAIRARYDEDVWEQVVKPLNDQLREHQKEALIAYLLVQQDLIEWANPTPLDADGLFEFFLIDVQMDACMQTSRIKQAISSVQLFIQRCLLGLEEKQVNGKEVGVPNDAIDRDRWEWMQYEPIREANVKVFLWPENWILEELRDDKSPFFKELESELLQKDINTQTVQDALKSYLIKVDEIANLRVVGLFVDDAGQRLHVFASTRNAPYFFYYRYFHIKENNWYPWEKIQVDVPSYDEQKLWPWQTQNIEHGTYLIPIAWNNRLLIFFPQFTKKTMPSDKLANKTFQQI